MSQAGESQLNIEADVRDISNISRAVFDFNGKSAFRTESLFPYALFGDHSGDFIGFPLTTGTQNLRVQIFQGNRSVEQRSITFEIVR